MAKYNIILGTDHRLYNYITLLIRDKQYKITFKTRKYSKKTNGMINIILLANFFFSNRPFLHVKYKTKYSLLLLLFRTIIYDMHFLRVKK